MYIGIDIGGTHTRIALGDEGSFLNKKDFPTKELQETLKEIKNAVDSFDQKEIKSVGVSIAGPYNFRNNTLHQPPNLPDSSKDSWREVNISDRFTKELGITTVAAHDASVAALGEAIHGAGKGKNPVLYYTVSTGIGSGLIVDGKIFHGIFNPEAGHQILNKNGESLESLASGTALKRKTGKEPTDVEGTELWDESMETVAIGLANSILHFSPEIVIVGGGMTKHGDVFFGPVDKYISKYLTFIPPVPIVPSGLGQDSSLIGALELAKQAKQSG